MAKKKFDNLKPTIKKPSDAKIDNVLANLDIEKKVLVNTVQAPTRPRRQKLIPLHVKLPETYYNALNAEAGEKGLSMKHIIIEALNERLKEKL